uniref:HTH psq-type domain-containing protein n=1 Tax=Timema bartmani TaxID=61472 RepID=A0A7R9ET51_9NEOP|nr:unnamed protein product [Timema bartmani]
MSGKRTFLTLMKKYEINQEVDEKKITMTEIARQHGIPRSTLFTILKTREEIGRETSGDHQLLPTRLLVLPVNEETAVYVLPTSASAEDPDPPPVDANSKPGPYTKPQPGSSTAPSSAPPDFHSAVQQESSNEEGEKEMEEEPEDIPTTKDVLKAGDVYSRALKRQGASEELWFQFYNVKDFVEKYEKCKDMLEGLRKNEEILRSSLAEHQATLHAQEQKYDALKNHAMMQLERANTELDAIKRSHAAEVSKFNAMLKKAEVKTSSLEESLEQKIKENQELASICDELISKVGSSGN